MRSGVGWVSLSQFFRYFLQIIIIAILARLLTVDDFGVMALAMAFVVLSLSIGDLGLSAAIVQKAQVKDSILSSLLWICAVAGLLLFAAMTAIAPLISYFFKNEIISPIIRVISVKFIIDSFGIVHDTLLRKELLFKRIAFIETVETLAFGVTSISLAFIGLGIWSLVYGYIIGSLARVILLWVVQAWRPHFEFSLNGLNELFGFARNVLAFKITSYLVSNIDKFIIGRLLGSMALGYYSMASNVSNFPQEKLCGIINRVGFPAFSKIQEDEKQLSRGYIKLITYASIVIFPLLCGLIILCPEFVRFIFGQKWSAMIVPLQYLCVAGMISSITSFIGIIFLATGHAEIEFHFFLIYLFVFSAAILIGSPFGLLGVSLGICLQALIMNIVGFLFIRRLIKINLAAFTGALLPAVICSLVMAIALNLFLLLIKRGLALPDISILISSIILGTCVYYISLYIVKPSLIKEMLALLHNKPAAA